MLGEADRPDDNFLGRLRSIAAGHPNPADATAAFVGVAYEQLYDPWDKSVLKHASDIAEARRQTQNELARARDTHEQAMKALNGKSFGEYTRYGRRLGAPPPGGIKGSIGEPIEATILSFERTLKESDKVPTMPDGQFSPWDQEALAFLALAAAALGLYGYYGSGIVMLPQGGFSVTISFLMASSLLLLPVAHWWSRRQRAHAIYHGLCRIADALIVEGHRAFELVEAAVISAGARKVEALQQGFEAMRLAALRQQSALRGAVEDYYGKLPVSAWQRLDQIDVTTWQAPSAPPLAIRAGVFAPRAEQQSRLLLGDSETSANEMASEKLSVFVSIDSTTFDKFCRRCNTLMNYGVEDEEKRKSIEQTQEDIFMSLAAIEASVVPRHDGGISIESDEMPAGKEKLQWILDSMTETPPKAMTVQAWILEADPSRGRRSDTLQLDILGGAAIVECSSEGEADRLNPEISDVGGASRHVDRAVGLRRKACGSRADRWRHRRGLRCRGGLDGGQSHRRCHHRRCGWCRHRCGHGAKA